MQPKALWFCVGVAGVSLCSAVDAQQLNVAVGFGYEVQDRREASLSRSFLQIAPTYARGRMTVTAPLQVSFRGTGLRPTMSEPLGFKSDDWVDLGVAGSYQLGRTLLQLEHHSYQLLSSGVLPRAGFGDVERDDRFLVRVPVVGSAAQPVGMRTTRFQPGAGAVPGVRMIGGYCRLDRWTETAHGSIGGPVLGVEAGMPLGRALTARAQVLAGRDFGGDRTFGEACAALRYGRGTLFATAQVKLRQFGGARPEFFADREHALSLFIGKELR